MIRVSFISLIAIWTASCVIIPIDPAEKVPFGEEEIRKLEAPATSKADIKNALGMPATSFLGGRWWIYEASHKTTVWLGIGPGTGDVVGGNIEHYRLLVRFDDDELISALARVTVDHPCDKKYGVCFIDGSLVLPVVFHNDIEARPGLCSIVFYAEGVFESTILLASNNARPRFPIFESGTTYTVGHLAAGRHDFTVIYDSLRKAVTKTKTLDCFSQETVYLKLENVGRQTTTFSRVATHAGAEAIRGRTYSLVPDSRLNDE